MDLCCCRPKKKKHFRRKKNIFEGKKHFRRKKTYSELGQGVPPDLLGVLAMTLTHAREKSGLAGKYEKPFHFTVESPSFFVRTFPK